MELLLKKEKNYINYKAQEMIMNNNGKRHDA